MHHYNCFSACVFTEQIVKMTFSSKLFSHILDNFDSKVVFFESLHCGWMDGWPAMETDSGRAMMKTPATKAKELF